MVELMPGTISNGTPAAASSAASSPPRPKIIGSPLEADHAAAGLGFLDDERIDLILRHRVILRALADVDLATLRLCPLEQFGIDEGIVNEHVGALDEFLGTERDEADVTRSGANEIAGS
jgi:hypothetical protein